MIVSKEETKQQDITNAMFALCKALTTDARCKEARSSATVRRKQAEEARLCSYCHKPLLTPSFRHKEACSVCGQRVDRLLANKSKFLSGNYHDAVLEAMRQDYAELLEIPWSLGAVPLPQVVEALDTLLLAVDALARYHKQQRQQEFLLSLEIRRKDAIRADLVFFGAKDGEWLDERVEELYNERFL